MPWIGVGVFDQLTSEHTAPDRTKSDTQYTQTCELAKASHYESPLMESDLS